MDEREGIEARREQFRREQLNERLRHADKVRKEQNQRQDERDAARKHDTERREESRRAENAEREASRAEERSRSREHAHDMYGVRRADKLADNQSKFMIGVEEEKEVTKRELLIRQLGASLYSQQLDADYAHDVRTRNLDMQEHAHRTRMEIHQEIALESHRARNVRKELRERLKGAVIEKLVTHRLSEHAKRTAADQELERMDRVSMHRTTEIREESAAREREIKTEYEAKKDFEQFMVNLRRQASDWSIEEIADVIGEIDGLE